MKYIILLISLALILNVYAQDSHNHPEIINKTKDASEHKEHNNDEHEEDEHDDHDEKEDDHDSHVEGVEVHDKQTEDEDEHDEHEGHAHVENKKSLDEHDSHVECVEVHDEQNEEESEHNEAEESHEDIAKLSAHDIAEFGIEINEVTGGILYTEVQLNGEVVINEENVTHISSRFGGVIKSVSVRQGQYVSRGTILAVIENSNNLTPYTVITERSGILLFKNAAVGEAIGAEQELFQVVDLSTVWVKLGVYQKDMMKIRLGQSLRIVDPFSDFEITNSISYVSPIMDEASRTVVVRATLTNRAGKLKPGMFVTGFVAVDSSEVSIRLPLSAVHQFEGKSVAFVQDEDGFEPRNIIIGKTNDMYVEVITGLSVGERYVSKNGFIIKSELGKSEMGTGHGGH